MSFDVLERSVFGGKPLELFEFSLLGQYWRYTTEDRIVTFNSADFTPVAGIGRSAIRVTQNIERSEMQVRVRGNTEVAQEFLISPPSEPMAIRIYRKHRGDPDYIIRYRGRVQNCSWEDDAAYAILQCTQQNWSLKQPGLRRSFQFTCPYDLYGVGCNVNRSEYEVLAEVVDIDGLLVTVSAPGSYATGYFAGGYALWEGITGRQDTRMITASTATTITVQLTTIGLTVGDTLRLYPGCDHSPMTCYNKFNNIKNYGGQPFIPTTNPFAGATIY